MYLCYSSTCQTTLLQLVFLFVCFTRLDLGRDCDVMSVFGNMVTLDKLLANEVRNDLCLKSHIISFWCSFQKRGLVGWFWPHCVACGILVPRPEIEPGSWHWKCWALTSGPPGSSQKRIGLKGQCGCFSLMVGCKDPHLVFLFSCFFL